MEWAEDDGASSEDGEAWPAWPPGGEKALDSGLSSPTSKSCAFEVHWDPWDPVFMIACVSPLP